jgi:hypothetical protein
MKLFKIELDNVNDNDYDSCIIIAESKEQVEKLCKANSLKEADGWFEPLVQENIHSQSFAIRDYQKWTIQEINIDKITLPMVICSSFNTWV